MSRVRRKRDGWARRILPPLSFLCWAQCYCTAPTCARPQISRALTSPGIVRAPRPAVLLGTSGLPPFRAPAAVATAADNTDADATPPPAEPIPRWLLVCMVFLHVLANAVIASALPKALRLAMGGDLVKTATALGSFGSLAALVDILITPQLGRLSDTIGRKPLLLAAPCLALLLRASVAAFPCVPLLVAVRVLGGMISATYMVSLRAALADGHRHDAPTLVGRLGLISAASGGAYAFGMFAGGQLASVRLRLPYLVAASSLALLLPLVSVCFKETLPPEQRVPFKPSPAGLGFVKLFSSGPTLRGLCSVPPRSRFT